VPLLLLGGILVLAISTLVSARTDAGFGVLSYVGTWAALSGGLWFLFDKAEEAVSATVRRSASAWLRRVDPESRVARWPALFAAGFDKVFSEKHLSGKCFYRSCVASLVSVAIVGTGLIAVSGGSFDPSSILFVAVLAAFINFVPDYVSLLETRRVIKWMRGSNRVFGPLVLDLALTTLISLGLMWGGMWTFGSLMTLTFQLPPPDQFPAYVRSMVVFRTPTNDLPDAVFFYSAFFTSVWVWLYVAAGAAVRVAGGFNVGLRLLRTFTDLDEQPFRSLGFAAVLITTLLFLAGIPLIVLN
jgi:hypothetical protein